MAQRDKVKELVGRGLNSYHTKSLQQMDRIEKKNKEQNHKISILSNELDNDYLTKTEEGSVISLEHSKEGMVYLDELQGNTLVNYCTDGSKELTLNGDIDVEGTFVTTTEGVDNGKVDVLCEGNTLVNLLPNRELKITCSIDWDGYNAIGRPNETLNVNFGNAIQDVKPNTEYTLIYNVIKRPSSSYYLINNPNTNTVFSSSVKVSHDSPLGINKVKLVTVSDFTGRNILLRQQNSTSRGEIHVKDYMLLEGDWTNKEIPSYFEGMKSVGQDDENGHKIEILSKNKNILSPVKGKKHPCFIKKGTKLVLSEKNSTPSRGGNVMLYDINGKVQWFAIDAGVTTPRYTTTINDIYYIENALDLNGGLEYQVEIATERTSYVPHTLNKKEILMNEPLRGLPSGVKDKKVKIGNKWYIERNCKELVVNTSTQGFSLQYWNGAYDTDNLYAFYLSNSELFGTHPNGLKYQGARPIICDKFPYIEGATSSKTLGIWSGLSSAPPYIGFKLPKNIIDNCEGESVLEKGRNYLKSIGDMKFIVEHINPIYEPLEIEPTLSCYTDITHISNNSIIPCNMKIKNSGYNAIIKPSTLYTVALDTNKSGTIGMNLGGAKATTTNNVATITTPATLADDSLRLYGKDIKGSKVRLLEGDKTNWIPSFFEGMKSSFEDKFDTTDNTYKMEILSNNKNLVSLKSENAYGLVSGGSYEIHSENSLTLKGVKNYNSIKFKQKLKPLTKYYISCDVTLKKGSKATIRFIENRIGVPDAYTTLYNSGSITTNNKVHIEGEFTTKYVTDLAIYPNSAWETTEESELLVENLQISEVVCDFTKNKSNKIQFSSIEPLRKWDRFIFKDNQLMIERNSDIRILNGTENWNIRFNNEGTGYVNYSITDLNVKEVVDYIVKGVPKMNSWSVRNHKGCWIGGVGAIHVSMDIATVSEGIANFKHYLTNNNITIVYKKSTPTYEEIPFELQKIILEGYENGTLFIDTNIPPTATVKYAGETPIVKATKLNKTEVLNNTEDINDNIIPYLCDMDYRVVLLQLTTGNISNISMARLFGSSYEMLKRDIMSKRYSKEEYLERVQSYYELNKVSEDEKIHLLELIERV